MPPKLGSKYFEIQPYREVDVPVVDSRAVRKLRLKFPLALLLLQLVTAQLFGQHTPAGTTIQILGTGGTALLGGDLTDPENDGVDAPGMAQNPEGNWNWANIKSSHKPDFDTGESSFNIFDNAVGGGNAKWC